MVIDDGRGEKVEITAGMLLRIALYVSAVSVLLFGRRLLPGVQFVAEYLSGPHALFIAAVIVSLAWYLEERVFKRRAKNEGKEPRTR